MIIGMGQRYGDQGNGVFVLSPHNQHAWIQVPLYEDLRKKGRDKESLYQIQCLVLSFRIAVIIFQEPVSGERMRRIIPDREDETDRRTLLQFIDDLAGNHLCSMGTTNPDGPPAHIVTSAPDQIMGMVKCLL